MENEKTIRYIDLFGGVGGFRLGIQRAWSSRQQSRGSKESLLSRGSESTSKTKSNTDKGIERATSVSKEQIQIQRDKGCNKETSNIEDNTKPTICERATNISTSTRNKSRRDEEDGGSTESIPMATQQFTCVWYNDIDKYAVQTYNKNFKENWKATDIRTIKADSIPDFDLLCGGFPCQAFSIAGKRKGFKDTRGTMFYEIARILKAKRPTYLLLENVKGLLSHDRGRTFATILSTLTELGYDVQWMVLNSKFFGVPQNRERVFIIGSLREECRPEILPLGQGNQYTDEAQGVTAIDANYYKGVGVRGNKCRAIAIEKPKMIHNIYGGFGEGIRESEISPTLRTPKGGGHLPMVMDLYNKKEHSDRSPALTEPHHNTLRVREGMKIRRLTPIECERLQGFPDNWTEGVSDTQRYKQMGNAVTVNVIQAIIERMFK